MGMFLSLSGVIGKTNKEVVDSLAKYASSLEGGLQAENLTTDDENCCVITEVNSNTTILYPDSYLEWDNSSQFISNDLNAPVFSFHIHDGDFWMYTLYYKGSIVDQFNPMPDYWDENISAEEMESWKGNASVVSNYVPGVNGKDIEKYLVYWTEEYDETSKAYDSDEYGREDWQLLDFMKKVQLPYPLDDDWKPRGDTYKLWTKDLRLTGTADRTTIDAFTRKVENHKKPWWKFW